MISSLIRSGIVNAASHLISIQSLELIMALVENYVSEERVVKSITGEIMLDLRPKNIEKVFHFLRVDQYIRLTYHQAERWYKEHGGKASKIIKSSYLIEKTPLGCKEGKVDMKRGYMKDDIRYYIILLSRVMGLPAS